MRILLNSLLLGMLVLVCACKEPFKAISEHQTEEDQLSKDIVQLDKAILSIYHDKDKRYWFGSNGKGVFCYDGHKSTNFTTADGLAGNQIRGIQGDRAGHIYFDTPNGISKYDGRKFATLEVVEKGQDNWALAPDDLWFKGSGDVNGVYRYDGVSLYFLPFPKQDLKQAFGFEEEGRYSPYGVYGVYKDNNGHLWFGTLTAGVYRYDGTSFLWFPEKELTMLDDGRVPGVRSIIEDKDGAFWLSNVLSRYQLIEGENGEITYQKTEGVSESDRSTLLLPYFMSSVVDDSGNLWMVTYSEGVWKYDGERFTVYPIKNGSQKVLLSGIYKDRQGKLWLGTHNAGVYRNVVDGFERVVF